MAKAREGQKAPEEKAPDGGGSAAERAAGKAPAGGGRVMYVGPTVPGIGIQNRVYSAMPGEAARAAAEHPEIRPLFIDVVKYPEANRMLREKKGSVYGAYQAALRLKNGRGAV